MVSTILVLLFLAAVVGIFKPYIPNTNRWQFSGAAVVLFFAIGIFGQTLEGVEEVEETDATAATSSSNDESEEAAQESESGWYYGESVDEMRDATDHFAQLLGSNTIDLDFPYGEQRGHLVVRQSERFGFDILIGVESGQIMCNSYQRDYLNVKFDDKPIRRYRCNESSDGTSNMVFVRNAKGFLSELKNSEKLIVEAEFFGNGVKQLTFDSEGLEWEH